MSNDPEKIAFLVDSCAELEPRHRKGLPVYVVPLRIACKDKDYNDGEDITAKDIYKRLEKGELPKTSLPDLVRVARTLENIKKDGYEKVIVLPLLTGRKFSDGQSAIFINDRCFRSCTAKRCARVQ